MVYSSSSMPTFTGRLLDNGRFAIKEMLGAGAFGVVYRGVDLSPSTSSAVNEVALKVLRKAGLSKQDSEKQNLEISYHKLCSEHPNVLTLHEVIEDDEYIYLVLDFCAGGDLFGQIMDKGTFVNNDAALKRTFVQMLDAVRFCHRQGVFHRDLKPENILCNADASQVFIADFGLATNTLVSNTFGCGSAYYMSPECIGEELDFTPYSTIHADIWALGIILVNMISRRNPWSYASTHDTFFRNFLLDKHFFLDMLPITDAASELLRGAFDVNPLARTPIYRMRANVLALDTFFLPEGEIREVHMKAADVYMRSMSVDICPSLEIDIVSAKSYSRFAIINAADAATSSAIEAPIEDILNSPGSNPIPKFLPHFTPPSDYFDIRLVPRSQRVSHLSVGSMFETLASDSLGSPASSSSSSDDESEAVTPESYPQDPAGQVPIYEQDLGDGLFFLTPAMEEKHPMGPSPMHNFVERLGLVV